MKGDTHSSRLSLLAANLVGSFTLTGKESKRSKPKNKPSVDERRGLDRKDFPYYMQLIDQDKPYPTQKRFSIPIGSHQRGS